MYKQKIKLFTIIITLLPCLIGLLLWNRFPSRIPTHFDANYNTIGWTSRPFFVFVIPVILTIVHIFLSLTTDRNYSRQDITPGTSPLTTWIIPLISLVLCFLYYSLTLGISLNADSVFNGFFGIIFIVIGIYLPRTRPNDAFGIRIPWTLKDPDNWRKTHRLSGLLYTLSGILFVANIFLQSPDFILIIISSSTLISVVYSFLLSKIKH